jgi:hypothetical protein
MVMMRHVRSIIATSVDCDEGIARDSDTTPALGASSERFCCSRTRQMLRSRTGRRSHETDAEHGVPALRSMLSESTCASARQALVAIGNPALDFLGGSLEDDTLPRSMRLHIPRSISRFEPADAIPVLWGRLLAEPDDLIQFKILRGIGRLVVETPAARPDARAIARAIHHISQSGLRSRAGARRLRGGARTPI